MKLSNSTLNTKRPTPRRVSRPPLAGEGSKTLHPGNFRSQKLRDLAAKAPHCFCCGFQDGTVVGAHSNAIEDGHGVSQKAHDVLAFVCDSCHFTIDTTWKSGGKDLFYRAAYKSTVWLLQIGELKVAA